MLNPAPRLKMEVEVMRALGPGREHAHTNLCGARRVVQAWKSKCGDSNHPRRFTFLTMRCMETSLLHYQQSQPSFQGGRVPEQFVTPWTHQILNGLEHLHSGALKICHRDIKLDNLLFTPVPPHSSPTVEFYQELARVQWGSRGLDHHSSESSSSVDDIDIQTRLHLHAGQVQICDFGWCAPVTDDPVPGACAGGMEMCGTPQLNAPEIVFCKNG